MPKVPVTVYGYAVVKATVWVDDTVPERSRERIAMTRAELDVPVKDWEVVAPPHPYFAATDPEDD